MVTKKHYKITYTLDPRALAPEINHAFYREKPEGISSAERVKTDFDITWFLAGEGKCRVCDTTYRYKPNDLLLIPPYVRREYVSLGMPTRYYWLNFTVKPESEIKSTFHIREAMKANEAAIATSCGENISIIISGFPANKKQFFDNIVRLKERSAINTPAVSALRLKDYLIQLLIEIIDFLNETHEREKKKFAKSVQYIESHYMNELDMAALARMEGISKSYYIQLFRKEYGITPNKYLELRRIKYARKLIEYRDKTVKDIANETGFSDQYYFSKVFKAHTGLSPKNYRDSFL